MEQEIKLDTDKIPIIELEKNINFEDFKNEYTIL
jgi:hypothetical protein